MHIAGSSDGWEWQRQAGRGGSSSRAAGASHARDLLMFAAEEETGEERSAQSLSSPPPSPLLEGPVTEEERATLAFFSIEGVGPVTLAALRERFGSLAAALAAPRAQAAAAMRDDATRGRLLAAGDLGALADRHLARAEQLGARVLFAGRAGWPRQLEGQAFPPILYVRGRLDPNQPRVAIVGSRESDAYGLELAARVAGSLARAKVGIVSGGAIGVDASAHRACFGNEGATIAVLGFGVDLVYPGDHRALFHEIVARGGALVSHYPPGSPAVPQNFVVRNKVIAALSDAVLVARAGLASGALGTARAAREIGRPLFAVPGDVGTALSAGANALLESGEARAATGPAPLARLLGLDSDAEAPLFAAGASAMSPLTVPSGERARAVRSGSGRVLTLSSVGAPKQAAEVPAELRGVYEALAEGPAQFDDLLGRCGVDASGLANALLQLELIGLCEERVGKVFARR